MTDQHATYAPSSAHRWTICTASASAIAKLPQQEESDAAAEGTAAHEELERILGPLGCSEQDSRSVAAGDMLALCDDVDGDHPAAYGLALFVDYVRQLLTATPGKMWIEQRVRLTDQIWGRLDCGHWYEAGGVVTIVDMKNGFVDVDAVENEQMRVYAASLILNFNLPARWIRYVVVQPNSFMPVPRVKQWIEPAADLHAWASQVAAIPDGPLTFIAGEQCKYCPLFGRCPTSQDVLMKLNVLMANPPDAVPPGQVAMFKACEKPIADWFKGLDKAATKVALAGNVPTGMKLVTATKFRTWKNEAAARAAVLEQKGVEALKPPTPAQAEEMGVTGVDLLAEAPPGGPALAFESDKRKPWAQKSAAEMFGALALTSAERATVGGEK
jgi:hypothetical protein